MEGFTNMITVPAYNLSSTLNYDVNLIDFLGTNIVVYFYPKDNTPGCINEAENFRDSFSEFTRLNCTVFGVSRDSVESHHNFKKMLDLPFELISDRNERLCKHFRVIQEKHWFDIPYDSIVRSTFLINTRGEVVKEWRDLKVEGHVANVLNELRKIDKNDDNNEVGRVLRTASIINRVNAVL